MGQLFSFLLLLALISAGIPGLEGAAVPSSSAESSQDQYDDSAEAETTTDSAKNLLVVHALLYEVGVVTNATGNETDSNKTDQAKLTIYDNNGTTAVEEGPYAPLDELIADHHLEKRAVNQLSKIESNGTDAKPAAVTKLSDVVTPLSPDLADLPLPIPREYAQLPADADVADKNKTSTAEP